MRRNRPSPVLIALCVLLALPAACDGDAARDPAPRSAPVHAARAADAPPPTIDEVAVMRAREAARTAGWTLVNPEALARIPPTRRDLAGLHASDALDAIARDAGLRADIASGQVHFVPGEPYVAVTGHDALDILVVAQPVGDVLQQLATANMRSLDMPPGMTLQRRVSLNFARVPLRTTLQLLADETRTRITVDAAAIRVRPCADCEP